MSFLNSLLTLGHGFTGVIGLVAGYVVHWWQTSKTVAAAKADVSSVEAKIAAATVTIKADVAALKAKVGL